MDGDRPRAEPLGTENAAAPGDLERVPRGRAPSRKAFLLRLRPELHADLERWAADEFRSVNAQIEYLLAAAVRRAGREHGDR